MRGGVVTEAWKEGESWYRKWSDGWVEQGGQSDQGTTTVTLNVAFSDTTYTVLLTADTTGHAYAKAVTNKTSSTFRVETYGNGANISKAYWQACGYAAD